MKLEGATRAVLVLVLAALALSACSPLPYRTQNPKSVERQLKNLQESDQAARHVGSFAFSLCYSKYVNTPEDLLNEAQYVCEDGQVTYLESDTFWTSCSLQQPVRASFLCTPKQSTEEAPGAQ